ncbi:recombinase family protein [Paracoccus sp. TOH]|uniref:recombinase family protein n=1 Tax=Paracoccus sp. TOH TaxID=1263728 RepID=UPI0025B0EF2C|nr:recombinase family protein [Paracoccus sp. TOH]WJS85314.1 recombinase family protein [Paracoccus sp. TOH]
MTQALRAAIYARFSSDLQRDASIEDQIRACRDYAARQGLEVVEVYSDRAVSGASMMRSGLQKLLRDAQAGQFDLVIAEALDRLSRSQADIATLYQRITFNGQLIETISEGQVSELHIGLTGTMNALFLKELGKKTHRGLKGRALEGKSAGGLTYGYKPVVKFAANGEPIRGDREIDPAQAKVVRRIFADYAKGISPKKIAEQLNLEKIPGPQGGAWGTSTIHGNRERGTGILNNELYVGRQVWNRLKYVKDPSTGKRVSRLNPEADWVITEVPGLRILDDTLWQAARHRQGAMKSKNTDVPVWDRRRPRFLFSGLMKCGCCGSGFSKVSKDAFGCSAARQKGPAVCTSMTVIRREDLEGAVLNALEHHLMDPEVVQIFCQEYAAERNRLQAEAGAGRTALEKELRQVTGDHKKLVDAIIAGVPAEQVKDRMIELDARRKELERQLSTAPAADPLRFHPSMAKTYRTRVGQLIHGLSDAEGQEEAKEALRALVEKIVLVPVETEEGGTRLAIDLHGALASLLRLATGQPVHEVIGAAAQMQKAPREAGLANSINAQSAAADSQAIDIIGETVLVAGAGNQRYLRLVERQIPKHAA